MPAHNAFTAMAFVALSVPLMATQCTANNVCEKRVACEEDENDVNYSSDAAAVCSADYQASIAALEANEEEECDRLARAIVALDNCRVGLSCSDFLAPDLDGECDDQRDELDDAQDEVDGFECTAQE
jgi:hypothetical protein